MAQSFSMGIFTDSISDNLKALVSFPVVITKERSWFVASCPILNIGTQGKTEDEVKKNMKELIKEYFADPDTIKPEASAIESISVSLTNIPVEIQKGVYHSKAPSTS